MIVLWQYIIKNKLSVRNTEKYIAGLLKTDGKSSKHKIKSSKLKKIEKIISTYLNTNVIINAKDNNKGKIIINYNSYYHLDKIINIIKNK